MFGHGILDVHLELLVLLRYWALSSTLVRVCGKILITVQDSERYLQLLLSQILVWNLYLGRRLLSQILVWDWCHKFWAGIGVTNFDSGAAQYAARRSSRTSARGLSSMVAHGDKEECRTDSPISLVCTVDACLYSFRFCIEFGSPTRGDSYACAKFVSTWNGPRF